jgi:DNA-binding MarR family transcriptional regulator
MKQSSVTHATSYQALIELLRTADTIWDASRVLFERWDLSPSQFNVLNLLHTTEGVSQTELSRELIMHRSNITGLVDRLEKRGLVERTEAAEDRRAYRVVLTRSGRKVLNEILPLYHEGAIALWENVAAAELPRFVAVLKQAARNSRAIANRLKHTPGV